MTKFYTTDILLIRIVLKICKILLPVEKFRYFSVILLLNDESFYIMNKNCKNNRQNKSYILEGYLLPMKQKISSGFPNFSLYYESSKILNRTMQLTRYFHWSIDTLQRIRSNCEIFAAYIGLISGNIMGSSSNRHATGSNDTAAKNQEQQEYVGQR